MSARARAATCSCRSPASLPAPGWSAWAARSARTSSPRRQRARPDGLRGKAQDNWDLSAQPIREMARGDPVTGMAASQAKMVHQGVVDDLGVDTTHTEALECARVIATRLAG